MTGHNRKTLKQIQHNPTPEELYKELIESPGWQYSKPEVTAKFLPRDRALAALLYLGDFRISEVIPLTTENFEELTQYVWVKDVKVGKKKAGKTEWREAKLPLKGQRAAFTDLVLEYLHTLNYGKRLFPWSLTIKTFTLNSQYTTSKGIIKDRVSIQMVGTKRGWQIVNALLPSYTEHWLRAFGYNYDYDHMDHDIMAVSDKTKADPRSLQPYLRRRYEKYPVR